MRGSLGNGNWISRWTTVVLGAAVAAIVVSGTFATRVTAAGQLGAPAAPDDRRHGERPKGTVWVVNRDKASLAIFDASDGTVLRKVDAVGTGAHDICIVERAGKAFITAESINAVTVVDLETLTLASIPVAPLPHHCEASSDGRTLYVSLSSHAAAPGAPQLAVIDTRDHSVTYRMTSANAAARAHGPYPSLDDETVYVAHDRGDEVTAVDVEHGDIGLSVAPILRAEEVVPTRFGDGLWVSSRGDGSVKYIDLRTGGIAASVPVGTEPESVLLTPSERTLAVSLRGSPATLGFVDTQTATRRGSVVIAPVEACGAVTQAQSFGDLAAMSRDGRYVFATFDRGANCRGGVSVVDVRRMRVVATWAYPEDGRPHGIAYTRKRARF